MKRLLILILSMLAITSFAQELEATQEDYALEFNSQKLENSTMVKVGDQEVPLMVVAEIQKICQQKKLTKPECDQLIQQGCLEFTRVYEDNNVQVTDIPVLITVNLHIHETKHTVHQVQKRYTYNYDIRVTRSSSETHEYKELPPIHEPGNYQFDQQDLAGVPNCPIAPPKHFNPKGPEQNFEIGRPMQTAVTQISRFWLPSCARLSHDIAQFIQSRRVNCQVIQRGAWLEFIGPEAARVGSIIVKYLPNQHLFHRATYPQVQRIFSELEYFY